MSASSGGTVPVMAAVHLAGVLDSLRLAEAALGVALESLQPIELEQQPAGMDCYDVIAIRETVRLFLGLFADIADGVRLPPCGCKVRDMIEELQEDERNPAGFERAALALEFAEAGLESVIDVIDETDESGAGAACYKRALAGRQVIGMFAGSINGALVGRRRPGADDGFSLN